MIANEKFVFALLTRFKTGGNPTKLFFFVNEEFFHFLLLSLAIAQHTHFCHMLQTLKLNSENWKNGKMKIW